MMRAGAVLPYWAAESLYNMVEVGTPVIVI